MAGLGAGAIPVASAMLAASMNRDGRDKPGHDVRSVSKSRDNTPTPLSFSAPPISSSTLGSSMVAGMVQASPSAIFLMVPRRILPERVFGRRCTMMARRNDATGPILSRTSCTHSFSISPGGRLTPALSTMKPQGTSPFSSSLMPSTAHSATSWWPDSTSSMPPVESLWPATLMMSSVRPIT